MLSECNQLLYPQLNSMRLTNNGNLAMLARNSLSHFALASGWVLKSFLHGEQRKEISAPSILSRMLKYLNINSFVLVITSSYIWHSAFPFSLLVLFYVKCHKHAPSLSIFFSPHTSALILLREIVCTARYLLHWPLFSFFLPLPLKKVHEIGVISTSLTPRVGRWKKYSSERLTCTFNIHYPDCWLLTAYWSNSI